MRLCLAIAMLCLCLTAGADRKPRTLTDDEVARGLMPAVGDTVILTDFARCFPHSAVVSDSQKGKWWNRSYTTPDGRHGRMICVEQRDTKTPETCLAPTLTYPPPPQRDLRHLGRHVPAAIRRGHGHQAHPRQGFRHD